jgi:hypothetical protein
MQGVWPNRLQSLEKRRKRDLPRKSSAFSYPIVQKEQDECGTLVSCHADQEDVFQSGHHAKLTKKAVAQYMDGSKIYWIAQVGEGCKGIAIANRLTKVDIYTKIYHSKPTVDHVIEEKFIKLRDQWKSEMVHVSSTTRLVLHPAYQAIIGMGPVVVPLLLRELEQRVDFWFWALHAITQEDPVSTEMRGDMREMAKAWISWGKNQGHNW